jgi:beta-lactamase superfamily II metal-dependent hydrolase
MKTFMIMVALALVIGGLGCDLADETTPTPAPSPIVGFEGLVITLERTACLGTCPVYELAVYGNGTVVYDGRQNVKAEGTRTATISGDSLRELIREFERIGYFSLDDSYEERTVTDMPSVRTSITLDDRSKTVQHYHGDLSAPEELSQLEDRIDEIVGSARWVEAYLPELRVSFIDVGQGDAILLDLGETEVLIDGGDRQSGVEAYLRKHVDGPLEAMIATHPHEDHIGGLIGVLDAFEVEEIWHNGQDYDSGMYRDFMAKVDAEAARVKTARRGDIIEVGDLVLYVLHPNKLVESVNDNSIVLGFSYGEGAFLFAGDAGMAAEGSMLVDSQVQLPDMDILKVGYHCSRTSSSQAFLEAIRPDVAIYMAGEDNVYGHPHEEALSRLQAMGAEVYGTDVHGTIVVVTRGVEYTVYSSPS